MSSNDPVAEWRARWTEQSGARMRPAQRVPRSPWVYAAAAFGGTMVAIIGTLGLCAVGLIILATRANPLDTTPESLTYRNDTQEEVWVYECYERCDEYDWGFPIAPGEEESFRLSWYDGDEVEWVVVTREDYTYDCIRLPNWEDQTVRISAAIRCPTDIHSPEMNIG